MRSNADSFFESILATTSSQVELDKPSPGRLRKEVVDYLKRVWISHTFDDDEDLDTVRWMFALKCLSSPDTPIPLELVGMIAAAFNTPIVILQDANMDNDFDVNPVK